MRSITYNNINVHFNDELDGGGTVFGQDYISVIRNISWRSPVGRVFEYCAGPGFIGFSILAHELCQSLCVADFFDSAVVACNETVRNNGLEDRVSVYKSDCLDDIPPEEKWDLVVSNPPHFVELCQRFGPVGPITRLYLDPGWNVHRRFYAKIKDHLTPSGVIIMQENAYGSHVETFRPMIEAAGLRVAHWHFSKAFPEFYYIYITQNRADGIAHNIAGIPLD